MKQANREIELAKDNKRLVEENSKLRQLLRERVQDNTPVTQDDIENIANYIPKDLNTEFTKEPIPVPDLLEPYGPVLQQALDVSAYFSMTACCI